MRVALPCIITATSLVNDNKAYKRRSREEALNENPEQKSSPQLQSDIILQANSDEMVPTPSKEKSTTVSSQSSHESLPKTRNHYQCLTCSALFALRSKSFSFQEPAKHHAKALSEFLQIAQMSGLPNWSKVAFLNS